MSGIDSFTTLMLHMDGADASAVFTDSSTLSQAITPNGNVQIDTAQSKFSGASALFDGAGDYLLTPGGSNFLFGTGDFTIDFWIRLSSVASNIAIFDFRTSSSTAIPLNLLFLTAGAKLRVSAGNTAIVTGTTALITNTWYHVAVVRSSGTTQLFLNGVSEGTGADATNYPADTSRPVIGISGVTLSGTPMSGWLDEFRVSKGTARWTAGFTPSTVPYTSAYAFSAAVGSFVVSGVSAPLCHKVTRFFDRTLPALVKRRTFLPSLEI